MASLSEGLKEPVEENKNIQQKDFCLTLEEVRFILAKLATIEFKGVEIEFTYNLILKLQEHFKHLSQDK